MAGKCGGRAGVGAGSVSAAAARHSGLVSHIVPPQPAAITMDISGQPKPVAGPLGAFFNIDKASPINEV